MEPPDKKATEVYIQEHGGHVTVGCCTVEHENGAEHGLHSSCTNKTAAEPL